MYFFRRVLKCSASQHKERIDIKMFTHPVDLTEVETVIYHLQDGPALALDVDGMQDFLDFELDQGHYCDMSGIDGTLHFFPRGNA